MGNLVIFGDRFADPLIDGVFNWNKNCRLSALEHSLVNTQRGQINRIQNESSIAFQQNSKLLLSQLLTCKFLIELLSNRLRNEIDFDVASLRQVLVLRLE